MTSTVRRSSTGQSPRPAVGRAVGQCSACSAVQYIAVGAAYAFNAFSQVFVGGAVQCRAAPDISNAVWCRQCNAGRYDVLQPAWRRSAVQCSAVQCRVVQCRKHWCRRSTMRFIAVQCRVVQWFPPQFIAVHCSAVVCSAATLVAAAVHCGAWQCSAVQCSAVQ